MTSEAKELQAGAEKVMLWEWHEGKGYRNPTIFTFAPHYIAAESWWPSTNIADAWAMENEIERRGLSYRYATAFYYLLGDDKVIRQSYWQILHATPLQRCRAALDAVAAAAVTS